MCFLDENPVEEARAEVLDALQRAGIVLDDELEDTQLANLTAQTAARLASEHLQRVSASLRPPGGDIDIDRLQIHLKKEIFLPTDALQKSETKPEMRKRLQLLFATVFEYEGDDLEDEEAGDEIAFDGDDDDNENETVEDDADNDDADNDDAKDSDYSTITTQEMTWAVEKAVKGYFDGVQKAPNARPTAMVAREISPTKLNEVARSVAAYVVSLQLKKIAALEHFELSDEMKEHNDILGMSPKQLFYDTLNRKLNEIVTIKHSVPSFEFLWDTAFEEHLRRDDYGDIYDNMMEDAMLPEECQPEQTEVERLERLLRSAEFARLQGHAGTTCCDMLSELPKEFEDTEIDQSEVEAVIAKVEALNASQNAEIEAIIAECTVKYNDALEEQQKQDHAELKHEDTEELKHAEETELDYKAQIEKMQQKNKKQTDEIRNLEQQLKKEKQKYEDEREKAKAGNKELVRAQSNRNSAATRIADLEATIKFLGAAHQEELERIERKSQALSDKVRELEVSLASAKAKAKTLETENTKLSKTVGELQQKFVKGNLEMQELKTETDRQRRDSKVCIDRMQIELIEAKGQIEELKHDEETVPNYEARIEKLQHTNKDQSNQIRNFKLIKVQLEEQLEVEREKVQRRNQELMRAQSNQKSAAARIVDLEATIQKLKAAQQEQQEQREQIRDRARYVANSLAVRDLQIQELNEKVRKLEVSLASANTKAETLETEKTKLSKTISELQSSSVKHKLEMKELTTKTDRQRRDSKVCIDRMQIELIEAKGQIEELQIVDRAAKMETDWQKRAKDLIDAVERREDDVKEQMKQLTREKEQLRSQKQGVADQIGRFEAQRQSMEATIANKDQMIEDLNEQMEQLSRENELTIDRVRQNGNEEIDRLKAKIEDQDKQHKQAMKARDGEVKEVLEATITNKDQMIEDLKEKMKQLTRESERMIDRARQSKINYERTIDSFKAHIKDQAKEHKEEMKTRDDGDDEVKALIEQVGELEVQMQNIEAETASSNDAHFAEIRAEIRAEIQKQYEDAEVEKHKEEVKELDDELKQVRWQRDQNREHIAKLSGRIADLEQVIAKKEKAYEMLSESKMELAKHTQHAMQEMRSTISLLTKRKELESSSVESAAQSETRWSLTSSLDEMMPFAKTWLPAFRS